MDFSYSILSSFYDNANERVKRGRGVNVRNVEKMLMKSCCGEFPQRESLVAMFSWAFFFWVIETMVKIIKMSHRVNK